MIFLHDFITILTLSSAFSGSIGLFVDKAFTNVGILICIIVDLSFLFLSVFVSELESDFIILAL